MPYGEECIPIGDRLFHLVRLIGSAHRSEEGARKQRGSVSRVQRDGFSWQYDTSLCLNYGAMFERLGIKSRSVLLMKFRWISAKRIDFLEDDYTTWIFGCENNWTWYRYSILIHDSSFKILNKICFIQQNLQNRIFCPILTLCKDSKQRPRQSRSESFQRIQNSRSKRWMMQQKTAHMATRDPPHLRSRQMLV